MVRNLTTVTSLPLTVELTPAPDFWCTAQTGVSLPHALILESVSGPPELARYSFLTGDPFALLQVRQGQVILQRLFPEFVQEQLQGDPLTLLRAELTRYAQPSIPGLPPFQGGAAGLFGYEWSHYLERLPRARHDEFRTPDLCIGLYDWVLACDHQEQRTWLVSTGWPARGKAGRQRARQRLREVERWLSAGVARGRTWPHAEERLWQNIPAALPMVALQRCQPVPDLAGLFSNFDRAGYLEACRRAIEYVHAGDCFQVNLAQRLLRPLNQLDPVQLYGRLRERNPAPFAGYFDLGDFVIVSASPERFVTVQDGLVITRPIKGTRPRGRTPVEDAALKQELEASTKDRAENVMIVDLMRNDLGRVCEYGSIHVPSVCRVESYQYVHHLVSEVHGRLRAGLSGVDLLRATFPGGSVTGAPKIRAMEIITELEGVARGPYCGCLGYLGFDGTLDTSILIRTFTLGRGWVQFPVGGGIVADSVPELEYEETWHKARGLLRALE